MATVNVPLPRPDALSFRRCLPSLPKKQQSQVWLNSRLANFHVQDFKEASIVFSSIENLEAPAGFGDVWRKIEHVDLRVVASAIIFIDLGNDAEVARFAAFLARFDASYPGIVLAQHSVASSRKGVASIERDQLAWLVDQGIQLIPAEPLGLNLVLSVRSKFMRVKRQCENISLYHKRLNQKASCLQRGIQDIVWIYLTQRMNTGIPMPSPRIPAGIPTILGDATLGSMLGEGACAQVYALKRRNEELRILKCLPKVSHTCFRSILAIKNAISILQRLSSTSFAHPNVTKLYEVCSSSSHVFLEMEYGGPQTLALRLQRRDTGVPTSSISHLEALSILSQCANALHHLHCIAHVAHRDLKPENIMFSETELGIQMKVVDFGLARVCDPETISHNSSGTFVFLAPEVVLEDGYNACIADVWSMGLVFLEILCFLHFPDTVLFRRRRNIPDAQAMEEVRVRLETSGNLQFLIQTYLRPEYRVNATSKQRTLCGMLNVVPTRRSTASDVSSSCAAWLAASTR